MEKIIVLSHYYDNGEQWEDYRDLQQHYYFSTTEEAEAFHHFLDNKEKFKGQWRIKSVILDTQETHVLWETKYYRCKSVYEEDEEERWQELYEEEQAAYREEEENSAIEEYLLSPTNLLNTLHEVCAEYERYDVKPGVVNPCISQLVHEVGVLQEALHKCKDARENKQIKY